MNRNLIFIFIFCFLPSSAQGKPINTLNELHQNLVACSRIHDAPVGSKGSSLRIRYSVRRDGSLFGQTAVTYAQLQGSDSDKIAFRNIALKTFASCFPVEFTDQLGNAIAGGRFTHVINY